MKILITGGAGYIGSTVASVLLDYGHTPILLDNLSVGRVEFTRDRIFYQGDIADPQVLERIFREHPDIYATIHCAALAVVPDSVARPFDYYQENVVKSLWLFRYINDLGCKRVIFSSSAAIYGTSSGMVTEQSLINPQSPYSRTKYMMEMVLSDLCHAYGMQGIALRYFNPIGSDPQLRTGLHVRYPSHLLGKLMEVALGMSPEFILTGVDWPTRDGTGVRDYLHVWDLALAHLKAVENFDSAFAKQEQNPYLVINLGSGRGITVREFVQAFERVYGQTIPLQEAPPRPGDVLGAYANADLAQHLLGWRAELSIDEGIRSGLEWMKKRERVIQYD